MFMISQNNNNYLGSFGATKSQFKNVQTTQSTIDFAKKYKILETAKQRYNSHYGNSGANKSKPSRHLKLNKLFFDNDYEFGKSLLAIFGKYDKKKVLKSEHMFIFDLKGNLLESIVSYFE